MNEQSPATDRNPWLTLVGLMVGLAAVVVTMLAAFSLPSVHSGPHRMPIGVAGPQPAVEVVESNLDGDAWDVTPYPDRESLTAAIENREVSGGIHLSSGGIDVYTATAGGAPAASAITAVGNTLAERQQIPAQVHDLVPFPDRDPRGAGLSAAALPLVFGGMIPAIALTQIFPGRSNLRVRLVGVLGFSLVAGAVLTAFLQYATGSLSGNYWISAAGLALGMASLSFTMLGLEALLGIAGIAVGGVVMMFLANPLSGLATGEHWLPNGWSTIGQFLPPGAAGSLLRANAFFDGAGGARPVIVLVAWTLFGLALAWIAARRSPKPSDSPREEAPTAA